jgi:hypothetical protein
MIDWAFALLFTPDIVKISLDSEVGEIDREADVVRTTSEPGDEEASRADLLVSSRPSTTGGGV